MAHYNDLKPCTYVSKSKIDETLAVPSTQGKRDMEPFKTFSKANGLHMNIVEDNNVEGGVEIHRHEADLWFCLEGEVIFTYGGIAKDPKAKEGNDLEIRAADIIGGIEQKLTKGDWLMIPAGQPHKHKATGTARIMIVKIPAEQTVPLDTYFK